MRYLPLRWRSCLALWPTGCQRRPVVPRSRIAAELLLPAMPQAASAARRRRPSRRPARQAVTVKARFRRHRAVGGQPPGPGGGDGCLEPVLPPLRPRISQARGAGQRYPARQLACISLSFDYDGDRRAGRQAAPRRGIPAEATGHVRQRSGQRGIGRPLAASSTWCRCRRSSSTTRRACCGSVSTTSRRRTEAEDVHLRGRRAAGRRAVGRTRPTIPQQRSQQRAKRQKPAGSAG